jgi:hypothetical protein
MTVMDGQCGGGYFSQKAGQPGLLKTQADLKRNSDNLSFLPTENINEI